MKQNNYSSAKFPLRSVLVTGGAGFIGARVVARLRQRNIRTIVVDNGYVGLPLPAPENGLVPLKIDIRDRAAIASVLSEYTPDGIIHLAAVHHIPTCEREPHLAFDVNVLGTQSLLDAAARAGVKNIVFASSGAVYRWDSGPLNEDRTLTGATDVYSNTKLTSEYQLACWAMREEARTHIARVFYTIGQGDPNGHLIPDILAQLNGSGDVVRLGNIASKRDYIYVDDVADGFVALLEGLHEGEAVEHFNLCTGQELSVKELVSLMGKLLHVDVWVESDPARVRKIDRPQQLGDPSKLQRRRNWRPRWRTIEAVAQIITELDYRVVEDATSSA
jgi:UDP-glucose 4-epimerase